MQHPKDRRNLANVVPFFFASIFEIDSPLNGYEIYRQGLGHGDKLFRHRKDRERTQRWGK